MEKPQRDPLTPAQRLNYACGLGGIAFVALFVVFAVPSLILAAWFESSRPMLWGLLIGFVVSTIITLLTTYGAWVNALEQDRRFAGKCIGCGFDLRETTGRCPECGRRFKRVQSAAPAADRRDPTDPTVTDADAGERQTDAD